MVLVSVLKRNGLVAVLLVILLTILRIAAVGSTLPWVVGIVTFGGFLWSNSALITRGRSMWAILLSLALVAVVGFPAVAVSLLLGRNIVEREYQTQGLEMVDGCNAAAANMADFDVFAISHRLNELTNLPGAETNQIPRLQRAYAAAQEKARILNDDCWRRGHRDNHPWKTNWLSIKPLADSGQESR